MGEGTEELNVREAEIEQTRAALSRDLDELGDKVSPQRVMERRTEAVKGRMGSLRDKVMGSVPSVGSGSGGGSMTGSVSDTVSGAKDSVTGGAQSAVGSVQSRTEGNPLAAGLVAFGAGMLISGLLPASQRETRLAGQGMDAAKEHGQPVMDQAKSVGQDVGANLKESAQQAVEEVRSTAADSASTVKEEGQSSAQTVRNEAPGT